MTHVFRGPIVGYSKTYPQHWGDYGYSGVTTKILIPPKFLITVYNSNTGDSCDYLNLSQIRLCFELNVFPEST